MSPTKRDTKVRVEMNPRTHRPIHKLVNVERARRPTTHLRDDRPRHAPTAALREDELPHFLALRSLARRAPPDLFERFPPLHPAARSNPA
jgi:hypothetical protein